jgi:uncharacterized protein
MHPSTYTLEFAVDNGQKTLLYNPLTKAMDVTDVEGVRYLEAIREGSEDAVPDDVLQYLLQRGYVYSSADAEEQALKAGYADFQQSLVKTQLRFLLVPTYQCNARCKYCFEHELIGKGPLMDDRTMDLAFDAMDWLVHDRANGSTCQLVLFGGEPFIDQPPQHRVVERILKMGAARGFHMDAVSNGFDLIHYVELLKAYGVSKVQVTFDGMPEYHNRRRVAVDNRGTSFERIVRSVDAALAAGIQINARVLLDIHSLPTLPDIVEFMVSKGWFESAYFSSHVGSIDDCFDTLTPLEKERHLSSREGNARLVALCREHPGLAERLNIDWHGARMFLATGQLFAPNYRSCSGATRTFAFDLHGGIYICETTVGKPDCRIGSFVPALRWNEEVISWFDQRNLFTLKECRGCNQALLCAGGCPFTGQVKHGSLKDLGCRSMRQTLEAGLDYYWPQIAEALGIAPSSGARQGSQGEHMPSQEYEPRSTGERFSFEKRALPVMQQQGGCCSSSAATAPTE